MTTLVWRRFGFLLAMVWLTAGTVRAEPPQSPPAAPAAPTATTSPAHPEGDEADESPTDDSDWHEHASGDSHRHSYRHRSNDVVSVGHDSTLAAGEKAYSVVSILGSSTSAGEAVDVVSVLGNTKVTGPVSNAAVAVLGNTYIDAKVGGAVAIFGDVELGPHAEVDGDVVAVLGSVRRAPGAIVHGGVDNIVGGDLGSTDWLHHWAHEALFYGRPLAVVAGLGWAWSLAFGYLALYVILALLFPTAVRRCVQTVEHEPGHAVIAALVTILLTPVVVVLLFVTVIGIAAVPFVVAALFCAALFGKATMLAWFGNRILGTRPGPQGHPAVAVALGGILVLVLYVIPILGVLVFLILGFLGFGAVLYTLMAAFRARQLAKAEPLEHAGPTVMPGVATPGVATPEPAASESRPASTSASAEPPSYVSAAAPRAGFWIRMVALLIDIILIGIALNLMHPLSHFHLVILAAYGAVMWKIRGSTVGGMVFDLHVVRLDGRPVEWETAIVRALGCFLSLAVVGLGFIWIAFDGANQAWHDKIAGTVVVRVRKPSA